jgi:hypothetical protein
VLLVFHARGLAALTGVSTAGGCAAGRRVAVMQCGGARARTEAGSGSRGVLIVWPAAPTVPGRVTGDAGHSWLLAVARPRGSSGRSQQCRRKPGRAGAVTASARTAAQGRAAARPAAPARALIETRANMKGLHLGPAALVAPPEVEAVSPDTDIAGATRASSREQNNYMAPPGGAVIARQPMLPAPTVMRMIPATAWLLAPGRTVPVAFPSIEAPGRASIPPR